MGKDIALQPAVNPVFWREFGNNLMISSVPKDDGINGLDEIRITSRMPAVTAITSELGNTAVPICDITIQTHCNIQDYLTHRDLRKTEILHLGKQSNYNTGACLHQGSQMGTAPFDLKSPAGQLFKHFIKTELVYFCIFSL